MSTSSRQALACTTPTCPRYGWPTPVTCSSCPLCHQPLAGAEPSPLAEWLAPEWAEVSRNEGGQIAHSWTYPAELAAVAELIPNVPEPATLELSQLDRITVAEDGGVRIDREDAEIICGALTMSPAAALELAEALRTAVERLAVQS